MRETGEAGKAGGETREWDGRGADKKLNSRPPRIIKDSIHRAGKKRMEAKIVQTISATHWGLGSGRGPLQTERALTPEDAQVLAAEDETDTRGSATISVDSIAWEPLEILARSGEGELAKAVFALPGGRPVLEEATEARPTSQTWRSVSHLAPEGLAREDIRPGNLVHGAELLCPAGAVLAAFWNCEPGDALVVFGCGTVVLDRLRGRPAVFSGFAEPESAYAIPASVVGSSGEVARILSEAQLRWEAQLEYFRGEPRVRRAINHALGILSRTGYPRDASAKIAALWTGRDDGTPGVSLVLSAVECSCFTPDVIVFAPYALMTSPESLTPDAAEKILGCIAGRARDLYRRDLLGPTVVGLYVCPESSDQ